jgi:hypothetical protein
LNKHKNGSPKYIIKKKVSASNTNNASKNSRSTINNNNDYDSIVDMGTNHATIDNRKKKSFVCPKNKGKKDKNKKQTIKNLVNNERKQK